MATQTVGILGGSFNPVHIGHMILASYLAQWGYVDKVWLTLSPRNPLKDPAGLVPDLKRLAMLSIAIKKAPDMDICDIELTMPRPSYTINTLDTLAARYPDKRFKLVIGSDNWAIFDKWRDSQRILDEYGVIVYPREGYPVAQGHGTGQCPYPQYFQHLRAQCHCPRPQHGIFPARRRQQIYQRP